MLTSQSCGWILLLWAQQQPMGTQQEGTLGLGLILYPEKDASGPRGAGGEHAHRAAEWTQPRFGTHATTHHQTLMITEQPNVSWDISLCEENPTIRERSTRIQAFWEPHNSVISLKLMWTQMCNRWERTRSWLDRLFPTRGYSWWRRLVGTQRPPFFLITNLVSSQSEGETFFLIA